MELTPMPFALNSLLLPVEGLKTTKRLLGTHVESSTTCAPEFRPAFENKETPGERGSFQIYIKKSDW